MNDFDFDISSITSKEWLLDSNALFWGLALGFATNGNQPIMMISYLVGHWIKVDDLLALVKKASEPLV